EVAAAVAARLDEALRRRERGSGPRYPDARGATGAIARLGQAEAAGSRRVERQQGYRADGAAVRHRQRRGAADAVAVDGRQVAEAVVPASGRIDEDIAGRQRAAGVADRNAGAAAAPGRAGAARVEVAEATGVDRDALGAYIAAGDRQAGDAALRIAGYRVGRPKGQDRQPCGRRKRAAGDVDRGIAGGAAGSARLDRQPACGAAQLVRADGQHRAGIAGEGPAALDEELAFR